MRVLWVFVTMLDGRIGSICSIDNLAWSWLFEEFLGGLAREYFPFCFFIIGGAEVPFLISVFLAVDASLGEELWFERRKFTIFKVITFARWYALTVLRPNDLKLERCTVQNFLLDKLRFFLQLCEILYIYGALPQT